MRKWDLESWGPFPTNAAAPRSTWKKRLDGNAQKLHVVCAAKPESGCYAPKPSWLGLSPPLGSADGLTIPGSGSNNSSIKMFGECECTSRRHGQRTFEISDVYAASLAGLGPWMRRFWNINIEVWLLLLVVRSRPGRPDSTVWFCRGGVSSVSRLERQILVVSWWYPGGLSVCLDGP